LKSLHSSINYKAIKREEQKKTNPFEGSYNLSKKTIDFIEQTASHLRQEKRRNPRENFQTRVKIQNLRSLSGFSTESHRLDFLVTGLLFIVLPVLLAGQFPPVQTEESTKDCTNTYIQTELKQRK